MQRVYLLTGKPGSGKTSLIKQVVGEFPSVAGGFYTEEIRSQGIRQGFKLVTLAGEEAILAHVNFNKRYRVGKYGVDVQSFDRVGVNALKRAASQCDLVIVDEIGKMELFSASFREIVLQLIGDKKRVLGTIMFDSNPWTDAIKRQPQVKLITVIRENHAQVLDELRKWLKAA